MSERKSVNKYYPPDFNPLEVESSLRKTAKNLKTKNRDVVTIRLMTPFSIRCTKCSEYIPKSRKFNGKKELLPERYLETIKIFRLSIKCPRCNNMISFRTDPKSADYVMECGGVRNYTRTSHEQAAPETVDETLERLVRERTESERERVSGKGEDKMQALEARLAQMQREQQDDEELERTRLTRIQIQKQEQRMREKRIDQEEPDQEPSFDRIAEEAFEKRQELARAATQSRARPSVTSRTSKMVFKKKPPRPNPLGIVKKRPAA